MTRTQPVNEQIDMDKYKTVEKKGHHTPNSQRTHHARCGCSGTTRGGNAYRDIVVKSDSETAEWDKIRFYHQSPVVSINYGVEWVIDTHGHGRNITTRERINKDLPQGFRITQTYFEVKLELPNGDEIEIPERFKIDYKNNQIKKPSGEVICDYEPRRVTA